MDSGSTRIWRKGAWWCRGCDAQVRFTAGTAGKPARWLHYSPRKDWNKMDSDQGVLWGERDREPCTDETCPCVTAGPDRDGIGGKTR